MSADPVASILIIVIVFAALIGLIYALFSRPPRLPDPGTTSDEYDYPQQGISTYDRRHDGEIIRAAETLEQRRGGRWRGKHIHVRLSPDAPWDVWRYAAWIWERNQAGDGNGVTVDFLNPGDTPTYRDGCIVPSVDRF